MVVILCWLVTTRNSRQQIPGGIQSGVVVIRWSASLTQRSPYFLFKAVTKDLCRSIGWDDFLKGRVGHPNHQDSFSLSTIKLWEIQLFLFKVPYHGSFECSLSDLITRNTTPDHETSLQYPWWSKVE